MIVVDTSALVAILAGEREQDAFNEKIATSGECSLSAAACGRSLGARTPCRIS